MTHREEYIVKMKLQLDELDIAIAAFEAKAHEAKVDAQETYTEGLFKLRQQSKLTLDKLEELKASSDSAWDQLVEEMEKVRDAFVHSFHYFKSHF
jgi:hypothetical protein